MFRIKDEVIDEFVISKSHFITYLKRVDNEDAASEYISEIKKKHPKATHHCQAVLISDHIQSSNDDGEPSGTAGLPMLEILRKRKVKEIVAVVVRYYGGIKLGAGGLIRAYSKGVNDALNSTTLYQVKNMNKYQVNIEYKFADQVEHLLNETEIISKDYLMDVAFVYLSNDKNISNKIKEITSGQALIQHLGNVEVEVPVKESNND